METLKPEHPVQSEGFDRSVFLTMLGLVGLGVSALVAMIALLGPEWVQFRSFAAEPDAPAIHVVMLRPPAILPGAQRSTVQRKPLQRTSPRPAAEVVNGASRAATSMFDPLGKATISVFDNATGEVRGVNGARTTPNSGLILTLNDLVGGTPVIGSTLSSTLPGSPVLPAGATAIVPNTISGVPDKAAVDSAADSAADSKAVNDVKDTVAKDTGLKLP